MTAVATLRWGTGGDARVESMSGDAIVLRSTTPAPPGARVQGVLEGQTSATLRIKVHACRRQPEGDFRIEGRCIDLTREMRQRLAGSA